MAAAGRRAQQPLMSPPARGGSSVPARSPLAVFDPREPVPSPRRAGAAEAVDRNDESGTAAVDHMLARITAMRALIGQ